MQEGFASASASGAVERVAPAARGSAVGDIHLSLSCCLFLARSCLSSGSHEDAGSESSLYTRCMHTMVRPFADELSALVEPVAKLHLRRLAVAVNSPSVSIPFLYTAGCFSHSVRTTQSPFALAATSQSYLAHLDQCMRSTSSSPFCFVSPNGSMGCVRSRAGGNSSSSHAARPVWAENGWPAHCMSDNHIQALRDADQVPVQAFAFNPLQTTRNSWLESYVSLLYGIHLLLAKMSISGSTPNVSDLLESWMSRFMPVLTSNHPEGLKGEISVDLQLVLYMIAAHWLFTCLLQAPALILPQPDEDKQTTASTSLTNTLGFQSSRSPLHIFTEVIVTARRSNSGLSDISTLMSMHMVYLMYLKNGQPVVLQTLCHPTALLTPFMPAPLSVVQPIKRKRHKSNQTRAHELPPPAPTIHIDQIPFSCHTSNVVGESVPKAITPSLASSSTPSNQQNSLPSLLFFGKDISESTALRELDAYTPEQAATFFRLYISTLDSKKLEELNFAYWSLSQSRPLNEISNTTDSNNNTVPVTLHQPSTTEPSSQPLPSSHTEQSSTECDKVPALPTVSHWNSNHASVK